MEISLIARNETGMFCLLVRFISVLIKTFCFDQWPSVRGLFVYVFSFSKMFHVVEGLLLLDLFRYPREYLLTTIGFY